MKTFILQENNELKSALTELKSSPNEMKTAPNELQSSPTEMQSDPHLHIGVAILIVYYMSYKYNPDLFFALKYIVVLIFNFDEQPTTIVQNFKRPATTLTLNFSKTKSK